MIVWFDRVVVRWSSLTCTALGLCAWFAAAATVSGLRPAGPYPPGRRRTMRKPWPWTFNPSRTRSSRLLDSGSLHAPISLS